MQLTDFSLSKTNEKQFRGHNFWSVAWHRFSTEQTHRGMHLFSLEELTEVATKLEVHQMWPLIGILWMQRHAHGWFHTNVATEFSEFSR